MDSTSWIMDSLSVEIGFHISIVNRISDSLTYISDTKAQDSGSTSKNYADSGFHKQNFPGFRNLDLYQSRTQISLPFVREIPFASSSERDLGTRASNNKSHFPSHSHRVRRGSPWSSSG